MKTAVSVPDRIFRAADRHARRLNKSRSQLYSEALEEYLVRHGPDEVTEAMNRVADAVEQGVDPFAVRAAARTLSRTEW